MFAENEENNNRSNSVLKKRKCVIEDVILKNKAKAEPLFVTFANGRPQENANLKGTLHQNISQDRRRRNRRVFTMETPRLNYFGTNFGNDIRTPSAKHTLFLGILDKTTGKMRLVETSSFYARPLLETTSSTNPLLEKSAHTLTYAEKQEVVATAFGSKRSRQYVNRRKQYQVDSQNMSVAINQAVTTAYVKTAGLIADSQEEESVLAILPECNREASCPGDVYKLESIAPDSLLVYMEESARQLLQEEKDSNPKGTPLFGELLASARYEENEENQVRLVCVALYVEYLLTFLRVKSKDLRDIRAKDSSLNGCPPKIKHHIMNEFTQCSHNQSFRSRQNEDSAICCVLVLSLIVNKYRLSVNTLLQSLTIPRDKINLLMKIVGATYVTHSHSYVLKIPLAKFTKQFKKTSRQRRN